MFGVTSLLISLQNSHFCTPPTNPTFCTPTLLTQDLFVSSKISIELHQKRPKNPCGLFEVRHWRPPTALNTGFQVKVTFQGRTVNFEKGFGVFRRSRLAFDRHVLWVERLCVEVPNLCCLMDFKRRVL